MSTGRMAAEGIALLDHIIVLLPHEELLNPPEWLTDKFNLTDGGKHADGKTENKLIIFKDGTYIELISFITPESRENHWWGQKPYGIIDWSFSTSDDYSEHYSSLKLRLSAVQKEPVYPSLTAGFFSYQEPQLGGRFRPDGVELKWAVTFPTFTKSTEDGEVVTKRPANLPFFCHDITPRGNRVNGNTEHPCGAVGISEVRALVDQDVKADFAAYAAAALNSKVNVRGDRISMGTVAGEESDVVFVLPEGEEEKGRLGGDKFVLKELLFKLEDGRSGEVTFSYPG
ncbi:hypothetical protein ABW19_dt0209223 [Dactylella cylindrospora]|nr:hypothetical protein ABW19_dt0209223 [Dactylella cylindrospora]